MLVSKKCLRAFNVPVKVPNIIHSVNVLHFKRYGFFRLRNAVQYYCITLDKYKYKKLAYALMASNLQYRLSWNELNISTNEDLRT